MSNELTGLTEIQKLHAEVMKKHAAILQSLENDNERDQKRNKLASLQKRIDKEYTIRQEINTKLQKYPSLSSFSRKKKHRPPKGKKATTLRQREHPELKGLGINVPSMRVGKPLRPLGKNKNKKDRRATRRRQ